MTELSPLIRLRGTRQNPVPDYPTAPLAFTFISPFDIAQSPRLPPQQRLPDSRTPSSPTIPSHQTAKQIQPQRFQDVLLFDPADGVLSLRRLSLDKHFVREHSLGMAAAAASVQALGVTSVSLPGMGGAGRLAGSPSRSGSSGHRSSTLDPPVAELVAQESTVATWDLQRQTNWVEIKQSIMSPDNKPQPRLLGGEYVFFFQKSLFQREPSKYGLRYLILAGLLKQNYRLVPILDIFYLVPSTFFINSHSTLLAKTITLSSVVTNSISAVKRSKSVNKLKLALILQVAQATLLLLLLLLLKDSLHHEIFDVIPHLRLMSLLHQLSRVALTTSMYQLSYLCIRTEYLAGNQSLSEIRSRYGRWLALGMV